MESKAKKSLYVSKGIGSRLRRWFDYAHNHERPRRLRYLPIVLIGFLVIGLFPLEVVSAETNYYPQREDVFAGSKLSGVFPRCIEDMVDLYVCVYSDSGSPDYTATVIYQFWEIPLSRLRMDIRIDTEASADGMQILAYNSSSSTWGSLATWDEVWITTETTWQNVSFLLLGWWYNGSAPAIAISSWGTGVGSYDLFVDYVTVVDTFQDELDGLKKELEEIRKKLDEVHPGEIVKPTTKLLPYPPGTREGLDTEYPLYADPQREVFYNWYDDPDASASVTLDIAYDSSWSDVEMLTDELWFGDYSGTIYVNDTTTSTKILQTTTSYSHFLVNDTSEGNALTVEVTSGTVKVSRMARGHISFAFDWYIDPGDYEHRNTFTVSNDLTENWREVVIVVAGNPDYTIQSESVVITDLDNNVELTTKNYELTATSFRMGLTWINSSTSRSFKIVYSPYMEGTEFQEPKGVFRYDEANTATLDNMVWLLDEVAISNPNSIDCSVGTRISMDMSSIPGNIEAIRVITADGSYLEAGPPLGNKWYTFYGLEIPAHSTVTVSVYVKAPEPTFSPTWLRTHGLWLFAIFFMLVIISFLAWMYCLGMKSKYPRFGSYTRPIAGFFWFSVLMTMLFGVLVYLA